MTLFRRRRPGDASQPAEAADRPSDAGPAGAAATEARRGPWDAAEVVPGDDLLDLGGLLVPALPGLQLRAEIADERVLAVTMILGQSALRVQPYAAPRTLGIWEEIRAEIAAGITQQGGLVDEVDGPFGAELRAQVPVQLPGGKRGMQAARYLGVDGPRWFLRGVITGAAVEPAEAGPIEELFGAMVVVRGGDPMAPRDPIPLRPPQQPESPEPGPAEQSVPAPRVTDLDPFRRGPEITEIR
jgi:hypothetical protein